MFQLSVPSMTKPNKKYEIRRAAPGVWTCSCPDHRFRSRGEAYTCKHLARLRQDFQAMPVRLERVG